MDGHARKLSCQSAEGRELITESSLLERLLEWPEVSGLFIT